jgi:hypothetical protein
MSPARSEHHCERDGAGLKTNSDRRFFVWEHAGRLIAHLLPHATQKPSVDGNTLRAVVQSAGREKFGLCSSCLASVRGNALGGARLIDDWGLMIDDGSAAATPGANHQSSMINPQSSIEPTCGR